MKLRSLLILMMFFLIRGKSSENFLEEIEKKMEVFAKPIAWRISNETVFKKKKEADRGNIGADNKRPRQSFWDEDKVNNDPMYAHSKYHPIAFLQPYKPSPMDVTLAQKKSSLFLVKLGLIALSKLIFTKPKTFGFLKMLLFKVPFLFFKTLIVLKGLKFLLVPLFLISAVPLLLFTKSLILPALLPFLLLFIPMVPMPVKPSEEPRKDRERSILTWEKLLMADCRYNRKKCQKNKTLRRNALN